MVCLNNKNLWYIKFFPNRVARTAKTFFPSSKRETASFDQNQNILQKILFKSIPFWPEPRSDECNFLSLKLSTLCSALINSIAPSTNQVLPLLEQLAANMRQSEAVAVSLFFLPFHPDAINPTATTDRHFVLSPCLHQETKMSARWTQRSTSTISRKNRGLWTAYIFIPLLFFQFSWLLII